MNIDRIELSPGVTVPTKAKCVECERVFNLLVEEEAGEWFYGHDCER